MAMACASLPPPARAGGRDARRLHELPRARGDGARRAARRTPVTRAASTATRRTPGRRSRRAACAATRARPPTRTGRPARECHSFAGAPQPRPPGGEARRDAAAQALRPHRGRSSSSRCPASPRSRSGARWCAARSCSRARASRIASTAATAAAHWVRAGRRRPGRRRRAARRARARRRERAARPRLDRGPQRQGARLRHAHRASPAPRAPRPRSSSSRESPLQALGRLLRPEGIVASAPILRGGARGRRGAGRLHARGGRRERPRTSPGARASSPRSGSSLGQLLAAIFLRRVTRPLVRLSEAAESLVEERGVRLEEPGGAELAELVARVQPHVRAGSTSGAPRTSGSSPSWRSASRRRRARCSARTGSRRSAGSRPASPTRSGTRSTSSAGTRRSPRASCRTTRRSEGDVEAIRREVTRAAGAHRALPRVRARPHRPPARAAGRADPARGGRGGRARPRRRRRWSGWSRSSRGCPRCVADAELLRQAFLNLCVNAVQAMQEQRRRAAHGARRARERTARSSSRWRTPGPGIDAATRRARVRAVLHDQGERDRARARHRAPGGRGARRHGGGRERARARARTSASGCPAAAPGEAGAAVPRVGGSERAREEAAADGDRRPRLARAR